MELSHSSVFILSAVSQEWLLRKPDYLVDIKSFTIKNSYNALYTCFLYTNILERRDEIEIGL